MGWLLLIFQSTASSCKLSSALNFICQHQNREYCHIFGWDDLWEEEDHIIFDSGITCVIFAKIPRTRFYIRKDDASEWDSESTRKDDASELSSDDRGESEIFEAEVVEYDD